MRGGLQSVALPGDAVSQLAGPIAGGFSAIGVSPNGTAYASFAPTMGTGRVYQIASGCTTTACTFALPGVTTLAAVVSDGALGVYAYDALGGSNHIVNYTAVIDTYFQRLLKFDSAVMNPYWMVRPPATSTTPTTTTAPFTASPPAPTRTRCICRCSQAGG